MTMIKEISTIIDALYDLLRDHGDYLSGEDKISLDVYGNTYLTFILRDKRYKISISKFKHV